MTYLGLELPLAISNMLQALSQNRTMLFYVYTRLHSTCGPPECCLWIVPQTQT